MLFGGWYPRSGNHASTYRREKQQHFMGFHQQTMGFQLKYCSLKSFFAPVHSIPFHIFHSHMRTMVLEYESQHLPQTSSFVGKYTTMVRIWDWLNHHFPI